MNSNPAPKTEYFGIQYEDGSWMRPDGYATSPGIVSRAWRGTRENAEKLIAIGVPLGPAKASRLPME